MSDLEPCDTDIYENGECVFITHTIRSPQIEEFVVKVREESGEPVDWHFAGGRARVLTTGDVSKVRDTLLANRELHDQLFKSRINRGFNESQEQIQRRIDGVWRFNDF